MQAWGLDDPTGKNDEEFIKTAKIIADRVLDLKDRVISNNMPLTTNT
jgi:arsenate reductase